MAKSWRVSRLILLAATAVAAYAYVPATATADIQLAQHLANAPVATGYSFNIPVSATTHQGYRLILDISVPGRQVLSVADTQGNTWHQDSKTSNEDAIWSAYEAHPLTAADHLHVQVSLNQNASYTLDEYSGIDPNSPVDVAATLKSGSGTSGSATLTTTQPHDLLVSSLRLTDPTGVAAPPEDTLLATSPPLSEAVDTDAPQGTYASRWTWTNSQYWQVDQVAYRPETNNPHEYVDGHRLYDPNSWVNSPLPATAPVDPNTASYMAAQLRTMDLNPDGTLMSGAPTGLRWDEGVDVYVTNSTDRSTWKSVCSSEVLSNTSWAWMNQLHNAWMTFKAPVPAGDFPATDGGSDHGATLYDAATGEMWDFYQWHGPAAAGTIDPQGRTCDYTAGGGDYQTDIPDHPGYFRNEDLGSGVTESNMWGRRASALPSIAGVITPDEWNNPLPDFGHTLQIIVGCANTSKNYWPATRHDGCTGTGGAGGLPEGARFRVDPNYVCPHTTDPNPTTGPTQLAYDRAYALCATLQKYGGVVTDQSGSGTAYTLANPIGGKSPTLAPDGGNCCSANTPPGTGKQWPNWYWDVGVDKALATAQVIDPSYRPPFAPTQ